MCECQERKKTKQNKTRKKKTQQIIKSFQFHRRSSTFFHLHNTNKWATAYLHSCSLKHAHSFWHTHRHTHSCTRPHADMCIWGTDTPLPHSRFHVFSCGFILNISPANYFFMNYPNVSLLVRETEGGRKKKRRMAKCRTRRVGNERKERAARGRTSFLSMNQTWIAVRWQEAKLHEKSMWTFHVSGQSKFFLNFFFLLVRWVKRQLLAQKEECVHVMERLAKHSSGSGENERGNEKK